MPTVGALSTMTVQSAGSVFADIEMLAVPFSLLLVKNGVEAVMKSKQGRSRAKSGGAPRTSRSKSPKPPMPSPPRKAQAPKASPKPKAKPAPKAKKPAATAAAKAKTQRPRRAAAKGGAVDIRNTFQELADNISSLLKMHNP